MDIRHWANPAIESSIQDSVRAALAGTTRLVTVSTIFDAPQFERFSPPVQGDPTLEINVTHPGGSLSLDSRRHAVEEPHKVQYQQSPLILVDPPSSTYDYPYTHDFVEWTLFDYTPEGSEMAYVTVSWDNHNVLDYLAGGYWMDTAGDITRRFGQSPSDTAYVGAFIDGPEFDPEVERAQTAMLPSIGTATYTGHAAGMYTYYYGASAALFDRPEIVGAEETGVWSGTAQLDMDFDRGKISGCIGCLVDGLPESAVIWESDGNIELANGYRTVISATYHNRDGAHFARYRLEETDLAPPGTTMVGNLIIENDYDFFVGGDRGFSEGVWESQFSHVPDASGKPRVIGGTMIGTWTGTDGQNGEPGGTTHAEFVGFFFAGP